MCILLETYIGKNKNMLMAEKELECVIQEINKHYGGVEIYNYNNAPVIQDNIHLKKLEEILANEFGFSKINIYFPITNILTSGPHTYPNSLRFFNNKLPDGRPDLSKSEIFVFMDISTNSKFNLTTRETMAILLHEIGHNIDYSAISKLYTVTLSMITLGLFPLALQLITTGVISMTKHIDRFLTNPILRKLVVDFNRSSKDVSYILMPNLKSAISRKIKDWKTLVPISFFGYYSERISDSVAVKYGYGADLAIALEKMSYHEKNNHVVKMVQSNPISGILFDFAEACMMLLNIFFVPHPANINRCRNAIKKLESELNNTELPDSLKKQIKKEIEELNKVVTVLETPSFKKDNYNIFRAMVNKLISGIGDRNRNILDLFYNAEKYEY